MNHVLREYLTRLHNQERIYALLPRSPLPRAGARSLEGKRPRKRNTVPRRRRKKKMDPVHRKKDAIHRKITLNQFWRLRKRVRKKKKKTILYKRLRVCLCVCVVGKKNFIMKILRIASVETRSRAPCLLVFSPQNDRVQTAPQNSQSQKVLLFQV